MKATVTIDGVELDVSDLDHLDDAAFEIAVGQRIRTYLIEERGADPDSLELVETSDHPSGGMLYSMQCTDKRHLH